MGDEIGAEFYISNLKIKSTKGKRSLLCIETSWNPPIFITKMLNNWERKERAWREEGSWILKRKEKMNRGVAYKIRGFHLNTKKINK